MNWSCSNKKLKTFTRDICEQARPKERVTSLHCSQSYPPGLQPWNGLNIKNVSLFSGLHWQEVKAKTHSFLMLTKQGNPIKGSSFREGTLNLPIPCPQPILAVTLLQEKFLQFDWLTAVVFQLNLKYLHVRIAKPLRVVTFLVTFQNCLKFHPLNGLWNYA